MVGRKRHAIRVFVDVPNFFIRPNNTDWRYMKKLNRLSQYIPIDFYYPNDFLLSARNSVSYISNRLLPLKHSHSYRDYQHRLAERELYNSRSDVIISHGPFPINSGSVPVVWQSAVLDPVMLRASGISDASVENSYNAQAVSYALATKIQMATDAEKNRHAKKFPALSDRFTAVPFFRPDITSILSSEVAKKHEEDKKIKILFVGREAYRKGLDLVLDAINSMHEDEKKHISFCIVSTLSHSKINMTTDVEVSYKRTLPFGEVSRLMREAHIFVMPSRFESFGLTYVEAMANGCAVIAPDWEVQKEICANGVAGINVAPEVLTVRGALELLCFDRAKRIEIAQAGLQRFKEAYDPNVVAAAYLNLFESACA